MCFFLGGDREKNMEKYDERCLHAQVCKLQNPFLGMRVFIHA